MVVGGVEGAAAPEGDALAEEGAGAAADEVAGEAVDEAGAGEAGVEGGLLVCGLDGVEGVAYNSKIMVLRLLAECVQNNVSKHELKWKRLPAAANQGIESIYNP